ncbi:hypothetical protein AB0J27_20350 [Micromonospora chokoriensis]
MTLTEFAEDIAATLDGEYNDGAEVSYAATADGESVLVTITDDGGRVLKVRAVLVEVVEEAQA